MEETLRCRTDSFVARLLWLLDSSSKSLLSNVWIPSEATDYHPLLSSTFSLIIQGALLSTLGAVIAGSAIITWNIIDNL
jgi:hypothetical protein